MKNKFYLLLIAIGIFSFVIYYLGCAQKLQVSHISKKIEKTYYNIPQETNSTNKEITNWQDYSSNQLGITFKYPSTWIRSGEELNTLNLKGETMSILLNMVDTVTNSVFSLEYHLPPYGAELYKNYHKEFNSSSASKKTIEVAGVEALETYFNMSSDIKGNIFNPPFKVIQIVFLNKQQIGEYHVRFQTTVPNENNEVAKFKKVISSLEFIDDSRTK